MAGAELRAVEGSYGTYCPYNAGERAISPDRRNLQAGLRVIPRLMRQVSLLALGIAMAVVAGCTTQAPVPAPLPAHLPPPSLQSSTDRPFFTETGLASFYGRAQNGRTTADGEKFDARDFTAAHRTLAFGTVIHVTDLDTGRTVKVAINDRGPNIKDRIIDLSSSAARALGMRKDGVTNVKLEAFQADQPKG
jgi:rare lipoprotein A